MRKKADESTGAKAKACLSELRMGAPTPPSAKKAIKTRDEKLEAMKAIYSDDFIPPKVDEGRIEAYAVGQVYFEALSKYYNTRFPIDWKSRMTPSALGCCARAWAQIEILCSTVDDYIQAQFFGINQITGKAPQWKDIAAPGAMKRYKDWAYKVKAGECKKVTINVGVIAAYTPRGSMSDVVMKHEENVLRSMIKQWGSEEKVWELFGARGDEEIFTDSFKETRDVWKGMFV